MSPVTQPPTRCTTFLPGWRDGNITECGQPAVWQGLRACVHEHIKWGAKCQHHYDRMDRSLAQACGDCGRVGAHVGVQLIREQEVRHG